MGSLSLYSQRQEHPGKSDAEIAQLLADKYGYVAVVRYKNSPGSNDYTNLGCCDSQAKLEGYFSSPYCHDTEIVYDSRQNSLYITAELIRNAKCDVCQKPTTEASLTLLGGDDYYVCSCGRFFCDRCYLTRLPLTNPAGGYGMCPHCRKEVKRAVIGVYV